MPLTVWRNIFSTLREGDGHEVVGRSGEFPEDLLVELEAFARGESSEERIEELCKRVACSYAELEAMAKVMLRSEAEGD